MFNHLAYIYGEIGEIPLLPILISVSLTLNIIIFDSEDVENENMQNMR
jgi:hypothetical protein